VNYTTGLRHARKPVREFPLRFPFAITLLRYNQDRGKSFSRPAAHKHE
jgi:hypothetical protein